MTPGAGRLTNATIALLPGDGIGPEVVSEARRVLAAAGELAGLSIDFEEALIGGAAIDATGTPLPLPTIDLCRRADAVLLGAVGGPRWDDPRASTRPEQGLLAIRRELGVYANLRPVTLHPALLDASPLRPERLANVDLIVVRELTGGIYFGDKGVEQVRGGERAFDICSYETHEVERVVRVAAGLARSRRGHLTSVDKANVLETSRLWRRVTTRVITEEYPDVRLDHALVDSCAMDLVSNPSRFDVIVTENMFGDILTDEAAVLTGSIGLLPSASLGAADGAAATRIGLYEPIHGSAPDIAGKGSANPLATILSVAMLLRHSLSLVSVARAVEQAVFRAISDGARTPDVGGAATTREVTDAVLAELARSSVTAG